MGRVGGIQYVESAPGPPPPCEAELDLEHYEAEQEWLERRKAERKRAEAREAARSSCDRFGHAWSCDEVVINGRIVERATCRICGEGLH